LKQIDVDGETHWENKKEIADFTLSSWCWSRCKGDTWFRHKFCWYQC